MAFRLDMLSIMELAPMEFTMPPSIIMVSMAPTPHHAPHHPVHHAPRHVAHGVHHVPIFHQAPVHHAPLVHHAAPVHHAPAVVYLEQGPANYNYGYAVADSYSGVNFGATEAHNGYATTGSYNVLLPNGRTQSVKVCVF